MFASWSRTLPEYIEVCPVQLPGHGERLRDRAPRTLEEALGEVLPRIEPDLPSVLFGHSLGAILAFEAAGRLRDAGRPPARLLVSGHRAPHLPMRERKIHHLPEREFVARLRELDGTPQTVLDNPGFLRMMLPVLRADFTVSETYVHRPGPPLDCPVTAFGGADDPDVGTTELESWSRHTSARFRAEILPGGHFYFSSSPDALLRLLVAELAGFAPARSA